jgi:hypothetical protein
VGERPRACSLGARRDPLARSLADASAPLPVTMFRLRAPTCARSDLAERVSQRADWEPVAAECDGTCARVLLPEGSPGSKPPIMPMGPMVLSAKCPLGSTRPVIDALVDVLEVGSHRAPEVMQG